MASNMKFILAVGLLLGCFHAGNAIKCYKCTQASGNLTAAGQKDTPCLNKDSIDCGEGSCARSTVIVYKPSDVAFEVNDQDCSPSKGLREGHGCSRTDSWSHDGLRSTRRTECTCNSTDNCNSATRTDGYPSSFLGLCIMWFMGTVPGYAKF